MALKVRVMACKLVCKGWKYILEFPLVEESWEQKKLAPRIPSLETIFEND